MASSLCQRCGGALRRSRRSLVERLFYAEAYRCEGCGERTRTALFDLKHARYVKCPRCHSVDLTVLKRRDGIDRMQTGVLNLLQKLGGGKLYHCWFCRLQFYDTRKRFNTERTPGGNLIAPPADTESKIKLAS
jgi:DNA-directed RNA polymerase subunit RPC12/RpoP